MKVLRDLIVAVYAVLHSDVNLDRDGTPTVVEAGHLSRIVTPEAVEGEGEGEDVDEPG